jgi:hypothetical protein
VRRGKDSLIHGIGTRVLSLIDNDPSLYLDEIQAIIFSETNVRYHVSTIWRFLNRPEIGYSLQVLAEKALQKSRYEQMVYRATMSYLSLGKLFYYFYNLQIPSLFFFILLYWRHAIRRIFGYSPRHSCKFTSRRLTMRVFKNLKFLSLTLNKVEMTPFLAPSTKTQCFEILYIYFFL